MAIRIPLRVAATRARPELYLNKKYYGSALLRSDLLIFRAGLTETCLSEEIIYRVSGAQILHFEFVI